MGTVTKSIGTSSRDYSTLAAWESALPANLVTDGNDQVGECYNDSEFTQAASVLTISGLTTDATNYVTLKCATGQSFRDNANVQTNKLRYNQANGVGIRNTNSYADCVIVLQRYTRVSGLQFKNTALQSGGLACSAADAIVQHCIIEGRGNVAGASGACVMTGNNAIIRNCLIIDHGTSSGCGLATSSYNVCTIVNNTIVRPTDKGASTSNAIHSAPAGSTLSTLKNNAMFGFSAITNRTGNFTGSYNASDLTISFGTNNQSAVAWDSTHPFKGGASTDMDFRIDATSDNDTEKLTDNGVTDATHGTPDIANTTRPSGSAYDIGCWELVAAAVSIAAKLFDINQAVNRASTF